ncbi:hypothetical protein [Methylocystis parvus]|uniref:DUF2946 domain-containing protein n=1 Tax=Methylocystis parvus TaxID=134 RepID=A0A6B8M8Z5_9HYPH|nr:hypothetical protein [Methylocystis parvus]QGM99038.1 hypothetical protein F7D14_17145 [Methylocystis parvus]WBK00595.1 hypothetical protein MMG94_02395 [Methylocystis parvus OBBP]
MRFGDVTPVRPPAAFKRLAALVVIALLQWSAMAAAESGGDLGGSARSQHFENCGPSHKDGAPQPSHCRHLQCCVIGGSNDERLDRAIVAVLTDLVLPLPDSGAPPPARRTHAPAGARSFLNVGSPRSPPANA